MHELAGIIVTPESTDIEKRMNKFCDYDGEEKPDAFCDGWAPVYIDSDGNLHTTDAQKDSMQIYCEELYSYHVRNVVNPYAGKTPFSSEKYYPAKLTALVTENDQVFFGDEIGEILEEIRSEHPDWGIFIINYHW